MNIYPVNAFLEYMETDAGLIAFFAVYAVIMLAIMAVGMLVTLAIYIMNAIAVKRMSQKLGFEKNSLLSDEDVKQLGRQLFYRKENAMNT